MSSSLTSMPSCLALRSVAFQRVSESELKGCPCIKAIL